MEIPASSDIQSIERIDVPLMNAFRKLLTRYISELSTDISEISIGLDLSRPVVGEFIRGKRKDLPLTRGKILRLHNILSQTDKLEKKNKSSNSTNPQKEARKLLEYNGPDELLLTAGFQPEKMKMVPVSSQQYSQLCFISFLYENRPISQEILSQIIKQEMDEIDKDNLARKNEDRLNSRKSKKQSIAEEIKDEGKTENTLINRLNKTSWIKQDVIEKVTEKYQKALLSMDKEGITSTEKAGLFKSVLNNQLIKYEGLELSLRVIRSDYQSISLPWIIEDKIEDLLLEIKNIGKVCESLLKKSQTDNENGFSQEVYPVTKTVVTCLYDGEEISFECISRGTHSNTAISAIAHTMGFRHSMSNIKMDMTWLGKDIRSLISTVVTIGKDDSNEIASGEWVSSDLLQSLLQATTIAGRRWAYKKFGFYLDSNEYKLIIKEIANLRKRFYEYRSIFDENDFDVEFVEIDNFREIGVKAKELMDDFEVRNPSGAWNTFIYSCHRIYILSKLYRLHYYNYQINHDQCSTLIEEIQKELNKSNTESEIFLIPSKISLYVEKIAYNLSFGMPYFHEEKVDSSIDKIGSLLEENNLLEVSNARDLLNEIDEIIEKDITTHILRDKYSNDPSYDVYHSLGSYYSITGRILFYIGKNKEDLDSSFNRFLKSAYYFQRIGLIRKVQRSLTLAGRVKIRCREEKYVKQCQILSGMLLESSVARFKLVGEEKFLSSMNSRLNLLKGKYILKIKLDKYESLEYLLQALKGSLWLGLNRHTVDILYAISQCVDNLESEIIQENFKMVFSGFWAYKSIDDVYMKFMKNKENSKKIEDNRIAKNVIKWIYDRPRLAYESIDLNISKELRDFSASIWDEWYYRARKSREGVHPFSNSIREGVFLKPIK